MSTLFTKTIAALQKRNKNDWELADALVAEVTPQKRGIKNGSLDEWEVLAQELEKEGISFSVGTLRIYRDVAARWNKEHRISDLSFSAHRHALPASDPRGLLLSLQKANNGAAVTVEQVKKAISPAKTTTAQQADYRATLTELKKAVAEITSSKKLVNWAVADKSRLAEVEQLVSEMPKAWATLQDALVKATQKAQTTQTTQQTSNTSDPKKKSTSSAASSTPRGRTRGAKRGAAAAKPAKK